MKKKNGKKKKMDKKKNKQKTKKYRIRLVKQSKANEGEFGTKATDDKETSQSPVKGQAASETANKC